MCIHRKLIQNFENEDLKIANAKVKEKTELQEKLIDFYEKKLSTWEAGILTSNMGINQLRKKTEAKEIEISTLKLQVQMLENEFSLMKNPPTKNPEEKKIGKKRKNKDNLNKSAPVEKKRGNVIQPTKVISSPSRNDSCTSKSPSVLKDFFVSRKNQNVCETVSTKSSSSIAQNSSLSKTDTLLIVSSDKSSENHFHSQSKNEIQPVNDNSSFQQNVCEELNLKTSNCLRNLSSATFSFRSAKTYDEKPVEGNLFKTIGSLNKSEIKNSDRERPVSGSLKKLNLPLYIPEMRNDIEKPKGRNSVAVDAALNKCEIKNSDCVKQEYGSSMEVSSLYIPERRSDDDVQPMEVNPVTANASLNKPEIRNSDIEVPVKINGGEKLLRGRSAKADAALNRSKTRNGDVEKPVGKHSVEINASLNEPEIRKGDIEELVRTDDGEKPLKGSSAELSLSKSETRNTGDEKIVEGISVEVATSLNKFEIRSDAVKPIGGNSTEAHTSFSKQCIEPYHKNLVELVDTSVKEQQVSSFEKTDIKSLSSNSEETGRKHSNFGDKFSSSTPSNTKFLRKAKNQKPNNGYLEKSRSLQSEHFSISIWKESHQDINDSSAPNLVEFMALHYPKLVAELDRIHNSKFRKLRHKTNPLFYKLGNINSGISDKYFMRYICSLSDFFTDPKTSFDMATIVYLIVDYLSSSKINHINLPTYIHKQEIYTILPQSENCIVSALYEVEKKSIPHLHGLLRNILNMIHRVIISKKRMDVNGLASLCRVFMDICRLCVDRWQPLFLCCESLKSGHPFAPYLINSLAGVWRDPFYLHNGFSVEERMLLGSIIYGMNVKPLLMDSDLWRLTCRLSSSYFPFPVIVDPHEAIQFLTGKIISRCNEGLFEDIWMLTSPLIIFVSNETWEWKMCFRDEYILPNLLQFSRCLNEKAFNLFCNLYVDICSFCHESPVESLLQFFTSKALYEGTSLVQDCAAIALLKYIGTTDRPIPAPLRKWFLRNIDNPKLAVIADLYCKKVMESQDAVLLWDDIIIL
ncbi:hypothetical protein AVEN_116381-1 [Araneus ventricosus]|uniref:Uncharacterized protein n=1 Tax=Araneus ventricosus TaxID=182803 RepID=A0A4Y2KTA2_ARAVE|nr:hypothetical protein AVEN_116381-1 [Araneus ventricosus]